MVEATYGMQALEARSGVTARTLRHWIREGVLPKPRGRGRAARYDERHLLRARVAHHLRSQDVSLKQIRVRISPLSEAELSALLPNQPGSIASDGVPVEPAPPTYPSTSWEVVSLMDGMVLMLNPNRGALLRRIADDIYRHYGIAKSRAQGG